MTAGLTPLEAAEQQFDASDLPLLEERMPAGGRPRQLSLRTLWIGMILTPRRRGAMCLTEVRRTLLGLEPADRLRLGVDVLRKGKLHPLTYRQVEYTFNIAARLVDATPVPSFRGVPEDQRGEFLASKQPEPADAAEREQWLNRVCDSLLEATIPEDLRQVTGLAVDWTDADSWAKGPRAGRMPADPNASWGRRRSQQPGVKDATYFGYGETVAVIVPDESGPAVPNLIRRMDLEAAKDDHAWQAVDILRRITQDGHPGGDLLGDCAYSHRLGLTRTVTELGFAPIFDLHPNDTGTKGTYEGAVISNGSLFCPGTPERLLQIRKPKNGALPEEVATHDAAVAERATYRFTTHRARDAQGYERLACPATTGKVRCPLRGTMNLSFDHPEILDPPTTPPTCCSQKTITVPPEVADKTRQKYPFASKAWRDSYNRRTGVERAFGAAKDKSCEDVSRGRIRVMGRAKQRLLRTAVYMSVNMRLLERFEEQAVAPAPAVRKRRPRRSVTSPATGRAA